jgi:hypothetical protein
MVVTETFPPPLVEQLEAQFTLSTAQMAFMLNIEAAAEQADQDDDDAFFAGLVASDEWRLLFGSMSWDQAYDRYEIMLGRCADC